MKKSIAALISILFLSYLVGRYIVGTDFLISTRERESTERACRYGAEITQKGFIGTEFENFDFYQSCLENSYNTSPLYRRYDAE